MLFDEGSALYDIETIQPKGLNGGVPAQPKHWGIKAVDRDANRHAYMFQMFERATLLREHLPCMQEKLAARRQEDSTRAQHALACQELANEQLRTSQRLSALGLTNLLSNKEHKLSGVARLADARARLYCETLPIAAAALRETAQGTATGLRHHQRREPRWSIRETYTVLL